MLAIAAHIFAWIPAFARTCAATSPGGPKLKLNTVRELVAFENTKPTSTTIFEGIVEEQQIVTGSIGSPSNAMSMTTFGAHRVVSILVTRVYRGKLHGKVALVTGVGGGDCGFNFRTGMKYLIYADTVEHGLLFTSICSRTDLSEHSGRTIRLLRGEPPSADDLLDPQTYYAKVAPRWTGKACGRVRKPDGTPLAGGDVQLTHTRDTPYAPSPFQIPTYPVRTEASVCRHRPRQVFPHSRGIRG
jgi:hypothetical protein